MNRRKRHIGWMVVGTLGLHGLLTMPSAMAQISPTVFPAAIVTTATRVQPVSGRPTGQFLTDTIEIGRPFQYALSFWHRSGEDVFFPDTSRGFAPFRVRSMAVFPTRTQGVGTLDAISLDSVVYTLVSFETDVAQPLQVSVRMTNGPDSVALLATPDTVFLRSRLALTTPPTQLTLVPETTLVPLRQQFNYPYLLLALATLLAIVGVIYGLFNRSIRRQWRLYQLDQRHIRFLREFNGLARGLDAATAADIANQAIIRWKAYLESLERQPYSSLTSREIADRFGDEQVTDALREADQMIYGAAFSEQSQAALRTLREVADQVYRGRRDELRQITIPIEVVSAPAETDV
ncbi:MAG: hypothetical protein H7Z72_16725 [Bacteroidetes bacterium]|nr:hypothetical protein [Fibrella sp.]